MPALKVLLGVGKQDHENQSRQDTSGYDVPNHGCHSSVVVVVETALIVANQALKREIMPMSTA